MSTYYCSHIETNAKGGVGVDLGPRTIVVGGNERHKSTIAAMLELALTRGVEGVGLDTTELATLASPGARELMAKLDFAPKGEEGEGRSVELHLPLGGKKRPDLVVTVDGSIAPDPIGVTLMREVRELLGRDAKVQRRAFLRLVSPKRLLEQAEERIAEAHRELWSSFVTDARVGDVTDADALSGAKELVDAALKEAKAKAKEAVGDEPPAGDGARIDDLQKQVLKLRADDEAREKRAAAERRLVQLCGERESVAHGLKRTTGVDVLKLGAARMQLRTMSEAAAALVNWKGTACPCCGAQRGDWNSAAARTARADAQRAIDTAEARSAVPQTGSKRKIGEIEADIAEVEGILATTKAPEEYKGPSIAELQASLDDAKVVAAAHEAWVEKYRAAQDAAQQIETLTALSKSADAAVRELLHASLTEFEARISQALLSRGQRLKIDLYGAGRRGGCRVGLEWRGDGEEDERGKREMLSWRTLAGSQRAELLSALACAWAHKHGRVMSRLVSIDEVAFDGEHLQGLCRTLGRAVEAAQGPDQAIVFLVELPRGVKSVQGWKIVNLG